MRNNIFATPFNVFFSVLCLAGMMFIAGCNNEPCADVACGTYGDCFAVADEGVCLCENGYEEDESGLCEIRSADKFVGTYDAAETCTDASGTFDYTYETSIVASDTAVTVIRFSNLGDLTLFGEDAGGNEVVLCKPEVIAIVAQDAFSIQGVDNGISYCDDAGDDVMFSGFRFVPIDADTPLGGEISEDQTTIDLAFKVEFSADFDGDGTPEDYFFSCTTVLTKK